MVTDSFAVFCKNITMLRAYYGYSKKQMAKLLGISVGSLNKIELGKIPPRRKVDVVFAVCKQFHIRPSAIFSYEISWLGLDNIQI